MSNEKFRWEFKYRMLPDGKRVPPRNAEVFAEIFESEPNFETAVRAFQRAEGNKNKYVIFVGPICDQEDYEKALRSMYGYREPTEGKEKTRKTKEPKRSSAKGPDEHFTKLREEAKSYGWKSMAENGRKSPTPFRRAAFRLRPEKVKIRETDGSWTDEELKCFAVVAGIAFSEWEFIRDMLAGQAYLVGIDVIDFLRGDSTPRYMNLLTKMFYGERLRFLDEEDGQAVVSVIGLDRKYGFTMTFHVPGREPFGVFANFAEHEGKRGLDYMDYEVFLPFFDGVSEDLATLAFRLAAVSVFRHALIFRDSYDRKNKKSPPDAISEAETE